MAYDLKNEDEAKEYIENLGVEYRFQCFHEKSPEGCHRLADYENNIKKDHEKAAKVYKTNCDDYKYAQSCFKYGNLALMGKGVKQDFRQSFDYYKKGCDQGHMPACNNLGLMFGGGKVTHKKDFKNAIECFKKACDGGFASSCYHLSGLYITGRDEIPKDMKQAHEYSVKACEGGVYYACTNLSRMYAKGDGVEKNPRLSEHYKKEADKVKENHKGDAQGRTLTFSESQ